MLEGCRSGHKYLLKITDSQSRRVKEFAVSEGNPKKAFLLLNMHSGCFLEGDYYQRAKMAVVFLTFSVGC